MNNWVSSWDTERYYTLGCVHILQGVDELPDEIIDMIYHLTFTVHQVHLAMGCVLLVLSIVLLCWLVRRLRCHSTAEVLSDVDVVTLKWRPSDLGLQLLRSPTLVSLRPDDGRLPLHVGRNYVATCWAPNCVLSSRQFSYLVFWVSCIQIAPLS